MRLAAERVPPYRPGMRSSTVRRSLIGALVEGAPFPAFLQPLGVFVVLAATVGGLVGPLIGAAVERRRERS